MEEYERKHRLKRIDVEEMGLNEGEHYESVLFDEEIPEEEKVKKFLRYIGMGCNDIPEEEFEEGELDADFNKDR